MSQKNFFGKWSKANRSYFERHVNWAFDERIDLKKKQSLKVNVAFLNLKLKHLKCSILIVEVENVN